MPEPGPPLTWPPVGSARIVCCQLAPVIGDLPGNIDRTVLAVTRAAAAGADLVVLPELATSGYVFADRDEVRAAAVAADHPLFGRWSAALTGRTTVVVAGFCELGPGNLLYNSAAVVDATGTLAVYRKTHLWDTEKIFFTPGSDDPPIISAAFGKAGVLICYDLEFPEMTRSMALRGAEVLAVPTNWPLLPRPAGERPPEVVIAMAAARANKVAIACCDRSGTERGQQWTEGTCIVGPDGWVVADLDVGSVAVANIDLTGTRDKALTTRSDLFGDRRPALYQRLVARGSGD